MTTAFHATVGVPDALERAAFVLPFDVPRGSTSAHSDLLREQQLQGARHPSQGAWNTARLAFDVTGETTAITSDAPGQVSAADPVAMLTRAKDASGLAWADIAAVLRVSRQSVNNWIRGEPISPANRQRIGLLYRKIDETVAGCPPSEAAALLRSPDPNQPALSRLAVIATTIDANSAPRQERLTAFDRLAGPDDDDAVPVRPAATRRYRSPRRPVGPSPTDTDA